MVRGYLLGKIGARIEHLLKKLAQNACRIGSGCETAGLFLRNAATQTICDQVSGIDLCGTACIFWVCLL